MRTRRNIGKLLILQNQVKHSSVQIAFGSDFQFISPWFFFSYLIVKCSKINKWNLTNLKIPFEATKDILNRY